jgi:DNA transformation protein
MPKSRPDPDKKPLKARAEPPASVHALAEVAPVAWRSMFGGFGIYCEGVLFGIVSSKERELYFRIGPDNRADYEKAASKPFQPRMRGPNPEGRTITMPYRLVPEKVLAKPATLRKWAEKALEAAKAARAARPKKPRRPSAPRAGR